MLLLDTSAMLWFVLGDKRLGKAAKNRLSAIHTVHFSSLSMVELEIKTMSGKLQELNDLVRDFKQVGMQELPFKTDHVAFIRDYPQLVKHDPFDRMLLAQAKASNLLLLTSDRALLELGEDWIIDARE